jgi:hypothetical protein
MAGVVRPGILVVPVLAPPPTGVVVAPPLVWLKAGRSRKTAAAKMVIALPQVLGDIPPPVAGLYYVTERDRAW